MRDDKKYRDIHESDALYLFGADEMTNIIGLIKDLSDSIEFLITDNVMKPIHPKGSGLEDDLDDLLF